MDTINPHTLSHSSSARTRTSTDCNSSPEFEFWMLRNPSFPQPNLLSADELIHDGVLLPLHLLPTTTTKPDPETTISEQPTHESDPEPASRPESSPAIITESSSSSTSTSTFSASKRWKDIFKKKNAENNNNNSVVEDKEKEKEKGKKKERKTGSGASGSAELNINIWPFSRSRSEGNNAATRPRFFSGAPATRKVNSAPCSRSNSAGESKSRKWPSSPGRAGVHVGRSSPVWQVRRAKNPELHGTQNAEKGPKKKESATCRRSKGGSSGTTTTTTTKARVLNLNVPMCIGYRQNLSCRSDQNGAVCDAANVRGGSNSNGNGNVGAGDGNDGGSGGNLFNLRNLFTKKSIVTSH